MSLIQRFMFAVVAVAAAVGSGAGSAQAAPVTFDFAGTVTQVNTGTLPGAPTFGAPFSGSYTFDSTSVDAIAAAGSGSYTSPGTLPFEFLVSAGGFNFGTFIFLNIGVVDGTSSDFYSVLACFDTACSTEVLELLFEDVDGTVFGSDALPLAAPPLAAFELAGFTARGVSLGEDFEILGQVTSLTCVEGCVAVEPTPDPALVPEPSTIVLCATGLIASVVRRRRR